MVRPVRLSIGVKLFLIISGLLFAGLTLEGASIRQDSDSRHAMYGSNVTTRAILLGKVPAPSAAQPFLAEIRGAKAQAVAVGKAETKAETQEKDKK